MQLGKSLVNDVKAGFVSQDTSFYAFCITNNIDQSNARKALMGYWTGTKATALCKRMIKAANVDIDKYQDS